MLRFLIAIGHVARTGWTKSWICYVGLVVMVANLRESSYLEFPAFVYTRDILVKGCKSVVSPT